MRRTAALVAVATMLAVLAPGCGTRAVAPVAVPGASPTGGVVRLIFAGDVMLGRGIAPVLAADGVDVFAGVRHLLGRADLVLANLESPLTAEPHLSPNPNALEADPAAAAIVTAAGFDLLGVANNHACDAGRPGFADTVAALERAGAGAVGTSPSPHVERVGGIAVAFLAFDITGGGRPCIAGWDDAGARAAVSRAAAAADVVVVGVHGGVEGLPAPDPGLNRVVGDLAAWGADVVWGHGAHIAYPVELRRGDRGRPAIVAPGLGNFLFDQPPGAARRGALLEVLAGRDGVVAYRSGQVSHDDLRVRFDGWNEPVGDAVALDAEWWSLAGSPPVAAPRLTGDLSGFTGGEIVDASCGDVTGDGEEEVVIAFRRAAVPTEITRRFPDGSWVDAAGRSAHLGVYRAGTLQQRWVAGTLATPVSAVGACDGAVAVTHVALDGQRVVAAGAWFWSGFGFRLAPELPGPGRPACGDVDGDGRSDPLVLDRVPHL